MITLYSTSGCHLCEQAYQLLTQANIAAPITIVDIAFDDELFSRYGVTIPVVACQGVELNWPFDFNELTQWLENNGINYHS
ncbi:glutaredoxin family protein [Vibrio cincinnatiensis]|uniref:glutaredoxin family protein n=1 Tax=Vibrio cincinnatiensis TaxID=675 RepID=UPI001EDFECD2|nr:glutaredoxin family protein [Vibrio cincinnatiensis]